MLYGSRLPVLIVRETPRLCLQMAWIETLRRRFESANALISLVSTRLTDHGAESEIAAPEIIELNLLLIKRLVEVWSEAVGDLQKEFSSCACAAPAAGGTGAYPQPAQHL